MINQPNIVCYGQFLSSNNYWIKSFWKSKFQFGGTFPSFSYGFILLKCGMSWTERNNISRTYLGPWFILHSAGSNKKILPTHCLPTNACAVSYFPAKNLKGTEDTHLTKHCSVHVLDMCRQSWWRSMAPESYTLPPSFKRRWGQSWGAFVGQCQWKMKKGHRLPIARQVGLTE